VIGGDNAMTTEDPGPSSPSETGRRVSWWSKDGLFGGVIIALIGAAGIVLSSPEPAPDDVCRPAVEYVADESLNPDLTAAQKRILADAAVRTVLECQRRKFDD
jgi:hypothetical protein